MNRYITIYCLSLCLATSGCSPLMKAFTVESPRPNKEQLGSVTSINQTNIPVIAKLQTNKQDGIKAVVLRGIELLPQCKTPEQAEALTNIIANGVKAIKEADGTGKMLGSSNIESIEKILQMPMSQYMAYATMQGMAIAPQNREMAFEGIKTGIQWTAGKIVGLTGSGLGMGGLVYGLLNFIGKAKRRKQLLVANGRAINKFKDKDKEASRVLTHFLAEEQANVSANAKKEHGLS